MSSARRVLAFAGCAPVPASGAVSNWRLMRMAAWRITSWPVRLHGIGRAKVAAAVGVTIAVAVAVAVPSVALATRSSPASPSAAIRRAALPGISSSAHTATPAPTPAPAPTRVASSNPAVRLTASPAAIADRGSTSAAEQPANASPSPQPTLPGPATVNGILSVSITSISVGSGGLVTAYWSMTLLNRPDLLVNVTVEWDQSTSPGAPNPSSPYYASASGSFDVVNNSAYAEYHYPACGGPQYIDLSVTGQEVSYLPAVTTSESISVAVPSC